MSKREVVAIACLWATCTPIFAQSKPEIQSMGIAVSDRGQISQIFNVEGGEDVAKAAAQAICEIKSKGFCSSIAVPMTWGVVVLRCKLGDKPAEWFVGGSGMGFARRSAINKANSAGYESTYCKDAYIY